MSEKERIEEIRFFLKKNKTEFAKVLGYKTPQSYTSYLSGKSNVSINMIKALKDHNSKISIDWILTGQGNMFIPTAQKIINGDNNNTQIGHIRNTSNSDNQNISTDSSDEKMELLKKEVGYLKKEIEHLKEALKEKDERLKDKDKLISILEKNQ